MSYLFSNKSILIQCRSSPHGYGKLHQILKINQITEKMMNCSKALHTVTLVGVALLSSVNLAMQRVCTCLLPFIIKRNFYGYHLSAPYKCFSTWQQIENAVLPEARQSVF